MSGEESTNQSQLQKFTSNFSDLDYRRIFSFLLIPIGLLLLRSSRQTWIEIAILNYKGTDDWYGKFTFATGILIIFVGIFSLIPTVQPRIKKVGNWISITFLFASLIILGFIALRVDQIGDDIARKARAPERLFEDTILEGLGRVIANISESISNLGKPKVSSGWRDTTILTIGALIFGLLANDWSRTTSDEPVENAEEDQI